MSSRMTLWQKFDKKVYINDFYEASDELRMPKDEENFKVIC